MCGCVLYHLPSILTLTHSLRSFVASPVKSYGGGARVMFCASLEDMVDFSGVSVNERVAEYGSAVWSDGASEQKIEMICLFCSGW